MIDQDYEYGPNDNYYSEDQLADLGVIWPDDISKATHDVIAERERQQNVEGWTPEHDDEHRRGGLALAAASYALNSVRSHHEEVRDSLASGVIPPEWPWSNEYWKPSSPRRDLIKAAALIIAEIERLDRAEARAKVQPTP